MAGFQIIGVEMNRAGDVSAPVVRRRVQRAPTRFDDRDFGRTDIEQ